MRSPQCQLSARLEDREDRVTSKKDPASDRSHRPSGNLMNLGFGGGVDGDAWEIIGL